MSERPEELDPTWGNCTAAGCFLGVLAVALILGFACWKFMTFFDDWDSRMGP